MSNTRRSQDPSAFNQNRFASSAEYQRGLVGNLVAQRCTVLTDPRERELLLFIQYRSHKPGGLVAMTQDLLARFPERFTSATMRQLGFKPRQKYNAAQVRKVREELGGDASIGFRLKWEMDLEKRLTLTQPSEIEDQVAWMQWEEDRQHERERLHRVWQEAKADADTHPNSYPAKDFVDYCRERAQERLPELLAKLCLDPASTPSGLAPSWCPDLLSVLHEYREELAREAASQIVETEISRRTMDALEYGLESDGIVIVEGQERIGKSFAARNWCEQHPGKARYLEIPSNSDDASFFRKIAEALGTSSTTSMKTTQIRERIERMLDDSKLMLVFDEAHYIWARANRRDTLPKRVAWLMTALANRNIPCALIATPQFTVSQKDMEARTQWRSGQFMGRIAHYERLPSTLGESDLLHLANAYLPEADEEALKVLADAVRLSRRGLGLLEFVTRRARYEAKKAGRKAPTSHDLARVLESQALPTDGILSETVGRALKGSVPPKASPSRATNRFQTTQERTDISLNSRDENAASGRRPVKPALSSRDTRERVGKGPELAVVD